MASTMLASGRFPCSEEVIASAALNMHHRQNIYAWQNMVYTWLIFRAYLHNGSDA
jgi:hypothetical protein